MQVVPRDVLVDQQDIRLSDACRTSATCSPGARSRAERHLHHPRLQDPDLRHRWRPPESAATSPGDPGSRRRGADRGLKGPASVLFGRGDPGGVINIVTRQPTLTPSGDINLQAGSFGFRRVQGSVSSAIEGVEGLPPGSASPPSRIRPSATSTGDTMARLRGPAFAWTPTLTRASRPRNSPQSQPVRRGSGRLPWPRAPRQHRALLRRAVRHATTERQFRPAQGRARRQRQHDPAQMSTRNGAASIYWPPEPSVSPTATRR